MTNMPLLHESAMATLNLATDEIRKSLQLQQYHKVIAETSTMVNDLLDLTTKIVELRALASEKTNNIAREHEDASLLIQLNPNSPNGYLRAAKLYSIQGKQSKAIQVLFAGIAWCPDQSQRAFLRQQIDKTKCHLERRIDFITQAPYDILCNILSHFTITTALTSIKVSQQWRDKVLHCPVPWHTIELSTTESTSSSRLLDRLLPIVSKYTKKLCLFKGSGSISHARLLVLPTFSRLQSLYISAERLILPVTCIPRYPIFPRPYKS
ncbi:hypothetical protein BJV82DRAFT_204558 [Fennellomyces sp. T-0311]|nr:hypothetical protein BJV82DRAFT_204558 [Fennellomyces sp. T-0311]